MSLHIVWHLIRTYYFDILISSYYYYIRNMPVAFLHKKPGQSAIRFPYPRSLYQPLSLFCDEPIKLAWNKTATSIRPTSVNYSAS